jgi:hypothetical protein
VGCESTSRRLDRRGIPHQVFYPPDYSSSLTARVSVAGRSAPGFLPFAAARLSPGDRRRAPSPLIQRMRLGFWRVLFSFLLRLSHSTAAGTPGAETSLAAASDPPPSIARLQHRTAGECFLFSSFFSRKDGRRLAEFLSDGKRKNNNQEKFQNYNCTYSDYTPPPLRRNHHTSGISSKLKKPQRENKKRHHYEVGAFLVFDS